MTQSNQHQWCAHVLGRSLLTSYGTKFLNSRYISNEISSVQVRGCEPWQKKQVGWQALFLLRKCSGHCLHSTPRGCITSLSDSAREHVPSLPDPWLRHRRGPHKQLAQALTNIHERTHISQKQMTQIKLIILLLLLSWFNSIWMSLLPYFKTVWKAFLIRIYITIMPPDTSVKISLGCWSLKTLLCILPTHAFETHLNSFGLENNLINWALTLWSRDARCSNNILVVCWCWKSNCAHFELFLHFLSSTVIKHLHFFFNNNNNNNNLITLLNVHFSKYQNEYLFSYFIMLWCLN